MAKCIRRPSRGLICVAGNAGVGNLVFFRHGRCDKRKRMRVHIDIGDSRFNCRHVAAHALAGGRAPAMMGVLLAQRSVQRAANLSTILR